MRFQALHFCESMPPCTQRRTIIGHVAIAAHQLSDQSFLRLRLPPHQSAGLCAASAPLVGYPAALVSVRLPDQGVSLANQGYHRRFVVGLEWRLQLGYTLGIDQLSACHTYIPRFGSTLYELSVPIMN